MGKETILFSTSVQLWFAPTLHCNDPSFAVRCDFRLNHITPVAILMMTFDYWALFSKSGDCNWGLIVYQNSLHIDSGIEVSWRWYHLRRGKYSLSRSLLMQENTPTSIHHSNIFHIHQSLQKIWYARTKQTSLPQRAMAVQRSVSNSVCDYYRGSSSINIYVELHWATSFRIRIWNLFISHRFDNVLAFHVTLLWDGHWNIILHR